MMKYINKMQSSEGGTLHLLNLRLNKAKKQSQHSKFVLLVTI